MFQADWQIEQTRPDREWPSEGRVAFEGYGARYRPNQDLVLLDINADIQGGEKVLLHHNDSCIVVGDWILGIFE